MSSRDHPDWWRPIGGQNSQDSILERRSLIWNDNNIEDGTVPDDFYEAETYKGKFFTRGCRGMLEQIQLYCIGDAVDEITLRYSPHPCLGPVGEVTIVPAAVWAWQDLNVEEIWNYDSLFIWVYEAEANVDWAYDAELPYDGHVSADTGTTWADMAIRPFIRTVMTGETPGDVPVSGIINTIEIPSVAGQWASKAGVSAPDRAYVDICLIEGAGTLVEARLSFSGVPDPAHDVYWVLDLWADDTLAYHINNEQITQSEIAAFGRTGHAEFWQSTTRTWMNVRIPLKFRRKLLLRTYQATGAPRSVDGRLFANLLR